MARITTHYTAGNDGKVLKTSLAACCYNRPRPTWNLTADKTAVTCSRCIAIACR